MRTELPVQHGGIAKSKKAVQTILRFVLLLDFISMDRVVIGPDIRRPLTRLFL